MGSPKALLDFGGCSFAERLARTFSALLDSCTIVLGYEASAVHAALAHLPRVGFVVNPAPERGMLSSLQCGLRTLPSATRAAMFTPVDFPAVAPATVAALARAARTRPIVVPCHGGRRGHPVLCDRTVLGELLRLPADAAPNEVIRRDESRVSCIEVGDPNIHRDIDDRAAYERLLAEVPV